jgi:DNA-binding NtrC family response regulator
VGSSESLPVNVRVIAATNRDPREAVQQRKLREDLLYRLQVVPIEVPPLRARTGDARLLANHFLAELNRASNMSKTFSEDALERIARHDWPGNVRELYNVVQRAFIMAEGRVISDPGILSSSAVPAGRESSIEVRVGDSLADVEQRLILHTVSRCRTQDEAARTLGVSNKTLYNKLRLYESQRRAASDGNLQLADHRPFPSTKF